MRRGNAGLVGTPGLSESETGQQIRRRLRHEKLFTLVARRIIVGWKRADSARIVISIMDDGGEARARQNSSKQIDMVLLFGGGERRGRSKQRDDST